MAEETPHPVGGSDYPCTLREFDERFLSEASCADYLLRVCWPDDFRCPACGATGGMDDSPGTASTRWMRSANIADSGDDFRGNAEAVVALVPGRVAHGEPETRGQCPGGTEDTWSWQLPDGLDVAP